MGYLLIFKRGACICVRRFYPRVERELSGWALGLWYQTAGFRTEVAKTHLPLQTSKAAHLLAVGRVTDAKERQLACNAPHHKAKERRWARASSEHLSPCRTNCVFVVSLTT